MRHFFNPVNSNKNFFLKQQALEQKIQYKRLQKRITKIPLAAT